LRNIRTVLIAVLVLLIFVTSTQGAELPAWSVSVKAGEYQPSAAGYDNQYGPRGFRGDVELGYKITRKIEMGLSVGYFSDNAFVYSTSGRASALTQQLTLIPAQLYMIYQLEFEDNQLLVPYIGGGYTHITYRHAVEGQDTAFGGKGGYHARAGMKLLLNRLEPNSANKLYENWGVAHTYFLLEGQYAHVSDFEDSSINLGGWSYFGGIQLDF
jgi:hypothetical protein